MKDWRPSEVVDALGFMRGGGGKDWCEREGKGTDGSLPPLRGAAAP